MKKMPRKKDDWLEDALKLGLGLLALHLLSKLGGSSSESTKTCPYCGYTTNKWARMCSQCRNTFPL